MIDKGVQVSGMRDDGKCSTEAAQLVTVTTTGKTIVFFRALANFEILAYVASIVCLISD